MTQAEYEAIERRLNPAPVDREVDLHDAIAAWCKKAGWLYHHERMDKPTRGQAGWPDFTILRENGRLLLIECKSKAGKLRPEQIGLAMMAEKLGHKIYCIRSMLEFMDIISEPKQERHWEE